jgi:GH35 family endo-1,4-beta-xylanase
MRHARWALAALLGTALLAGGGLVALSLRGDGLVAGARARIERHRMREVDLRLVDAAGHPLPGAEVRVEMTRHAFLFGANLFALGRFPSAGENARYEALFEELFDYATLPFYLGSYEPARGETQQAALERMVGWALPRGIALKGHPLVWHAPAIEPAWLPEDPAAVEAVHEERIAEIVGRFRGRIGSWDVLNEPTVSWLYETRVSRWEAARGPVEVGRLALTWAAAADPGARLLVNDFNVGPGPWWLLPLLQPRRTLALLRSPVRHHFLSYRGYLEALTRAGGRFDAIGLQSHMHSGRWPLALVWRTCERYLALGKPLHWTELTVLSGAERTIRPDDPAWKPVWPSTPEGERAQAAYVERLYTLLFSHPAVEAITWWDLSDREAWMGAPAGLVRADLSPKPAYERLRRLIRERWWTRFAGRSDSRGRVRLRGYCGEHALTLGGGRRGSFDIDCAAPDGAALEVVLR